MENDYPTEAELRRIREWRVDKKSMFDFLGYIKSLWWCAERGFVCKGKKVLKLELHTGGWSGNEDIIHALKENKSHFWFFYWQKSVRGGHYYFRIPLF